MTAADSLEPTVLGAGWHHRKVVAAWIIVAVVLTGGYLGLRPTKYHGTASIVLQQGTAPGANPTVTPDRFVADQVALLRSPVVASRAGTILNKGDSNVPPQSGTSLGPVSVTSSPTDSEVNISVSAKTAPEADADVRALLDAFSLVQNENLQAATNGALQQIDSTIASVDAQLAKLNPSGTTNPDPRVANQVNQLLAERLTLQQQSDQIRVSNNLSAGRFIVSSQPRASRQSIRGIGLKLGIVAVALGFLIGLGHAYLIALRKRRFENKAQPQVVLGAPLLIDVPDLGPDLRGDQIAVRDAPKSEGAEAFAFAAQMQLGKHTERPVGGVVMAVTSADGGSGTTTVVANLGLALARSGFQVLLVDGGVPSGQGRTRRDKGESSLTELFLGPGGAFMGLEDVTEGDVALADAAGTVDHRKLVLLGGGGRLGSNDTVVQRPAADEAVTSEFGGSNGTSNGSSEPGASAVRAATRQAVVETGAVSLTGPSALSWSGVEHLLAEARAIFDCVLIDTPPVLHIGARGVLLQAADQVVLVVAEGERMAHVQDSRDRIHALGSTLAGYVYNRMPGYGRGRKSRRFLR